MSVCLLLRTLCVTLMLGAAMLAAPGAAYAQAAQVTCHITTAPTLSFGNIDIQTTGVKTQATVGWTCSNPSIARAAYVTFCINIGNGSRGLQGANRVMSAGDTQNLQFQMYQDAAATVVWGSLLSSVNATPYQTNFTVPLGLTALAPGTYNGTATVYGVMASAQSGLTSGSYLASFGGPDAEITVASDFTSAPASCGMQNTSTFNFTASATVTRSCAINAGSKLDFGTSTGLLATKIDASTTLETQCTGGTPFQIALDRGQHATGDTRRMLGSSNELVTYELYRDNARTMIWANNLGSDTVAGVGNGAVQSTTVYGRVTAQDTPTPGAYTDIITISVIY